jgi:hypothetical protein
LTTNNSSYIGYILKLIFIKNLLDPVQTENTFYPGHCRYYFYSEIADIFKELGAEVKYARNINFLPHFALYRNRTFGFFKNLLIRSCPLKYSTNIEILIEKK